MLAVHTLEHDPTDGSMSESTDESRATDAGSRLDLPVDLPYDRTRREPMDKCRCELDMCLSFKRCRLFSPVPIGLSLGECLHHSNEHVPVVGVPVTVL